MNRRAIPLCYMWLFAFVIAFLSVFFTTTSTVHSQFAPVGGEGVQLTLNPSFPTPYSSVTISLDDYSVDAIGADVSWYTDGRELTESRNKRSIRITTGATGEKLDVRVVLTKNGALPLTKTLTITPSTIDIIVESNTYVPQFYNGRALPSTNSVVRVIAVTNDGTGATPSSYSYKWSRDGAVLLGGPVKGKNVIDIPVPTFGDGDVAVEVFGSTGNSIGKKSATLAVVEPEIHFYEWSPLRGLSLREINEPYSFVGDEVTLFGEPYFLNTLINTDTTSFSWKINSENVFGNTNVPNSLVLQKTGASGNALIEYDVITKSIVPQFVQRMLQLNFD